MHKEATAQATIYITATAMATVSALEGLDHYERAIRAMKPETALHNRAGYHLNASAMRLEVLPEGADVALRLTPADARTYRRHVRFPPELRGVVFGGAPHLPDNYAAILGYWSPLQVTSLHDGAQYCQNILNEYMVSFGPPPNSGQSTTAAPDRPHDVLLSDGLVVCLKDVGVLVSGLQPEQFVEVEIPVNVEMLGEDLEGFHSRKAYRARPGQPTERIYLRVADVLTSPNPDFIAIAAVHTELWDYGYYY